MIEFLDTTAPAFAEFAVTSNFSFLRGASHPEEMVAAAAALGYAGIGIADRNSLAGVVRAHVHAREHTSPMRVVTGARLVFNDLTPDILAYPRDRAAYGRLARLLTLGNRRAIKGDCELGLADVLAHAEGLQLIVMPTADGDGEHRALAALTKAGASLWLAASLTYGTHMRKSLMQRKALAQQHNLPLIATNDVVMHEPSRRA